MSKVKVYLTTTPVKRVIAEPVTLKLSESSFADISEALEKSRFHVQNPEDSCRRCDDDESFNYWKDQTLAKYPNAELVVTKGENWFAEVRVSDPFFKADQEGYIDRKANILQSTGY